MSLREAAQQALEAMACMRDMVAHPDNLQFIDNAITALRTALAEPEQEQACSNTYGCECSKHYTHPPQRKPLTDEEIEDVIAEWWRDDLKMKYKELARAIEHAHGIGGEA
jgi:hypothetical protein